MPDRSETAHSERELWICLGCGRFGASASEVLAQGCEGHPQRFVSGAEVDRYRAAIEDYAEQVRGIVAEAIYESKRTKRTPGQIADDVATKVADLLAAAEREGSKPTDEQR